MPTFEGVGIEGVNIQDIKPVVAEGEKLEGGEFTIQIYGDTGILEASYTYYFGDQVGDGDGPNGWYDDDDESYVVKTFDVGEAFNVFAGKAGMLNYSGQVVTAQTSVPVRKKLSAQGNFRVTGVDIQKITPVVAEGEKLEGGEFTIQIYGDTGILEASYTYYFGDQVGDGDGPNGWYDDDDESYVVKTFAPGEAFNVFAGKTGSLVFEALSL